MNAELESEVLGLMIPGKWMLKEKLGGISDDNGELEIEVSELRKVKEKKSELETQVCDLRKLKGKLVDENTQLRSCLLCVLEGERNTLVALVSKDDELEEEVKRNLTTIDELRKENRKLEEEKCKYQKMVESLNRKFAQPLSKGNKDEKGSSLARGRMESQKVIEIIDLDDDEHDECTSRVLHGKKAGFGITVKTEYPCSSVEIQQKNSFSKQSLEIIRKFSFSSSDTFASSDTSASSFNLDDLPFSPAQLQAKRRKT